MCMTDLSGDRRRWPSERKLATATPDRFPDRSVALPALEAHGRRRRRDARHGRRREGRACSRAMSSSSIPTISASTSSLADAIERLRFEHPQVKVVLLRSAKPRVFCAGANIRMLAGATHAHKVNFCKFTNETRNGIEDASATSGLKTICVINGTAAGGGYELALAADHIMLVDDGSSTVSLPELPLLAVLPGTGGLTRVTDKRKVRRDHADVFCTTEEGIKGKRAVDWRLVDEAVPGSKFDEAVAARARGVRGAIAAPQPAARASRSTPLKRERTENGDRIQRACRSSSTRAERHRHHHAARAATPPPAVRRRDGGAGRGRSGRCELARELDDAILDIRAQRVRRRCDRVQDRPAIRRRCWPTTRSSTPTRITGWRAKSGRCGSACSSASISPRARWWRWSSPARALPARWPNSCSPPTAPTC